MLSRAHCGVDEVWLAVAQEMSMLMLAQWWPSKLRAILKQSAAARIAQTLADMKAE